ncbi:MAG: TonB-dependent receptor [Balneolaceae bacterium]
MRNRVNKYNKLFLLLIPLLLLSVESFAQNSISGRVLDAETSESLPGVNILIKGTSTGTATDANGDFEIAVKSLQDTLVFSYIGFETAIVPIDGETTLDVELHAEALTGEELVVVGYGRQKKESVVGSQATIEPSKIQSAPVRNLSTSLAGKVAGIVSVQRSGTPGFDNAEIWIRGISTFDQNLSHPLVLVDGVPRDFNDIDPEDIESFSILKDASATAVYGVRGANGVILINTKTGNIGKPKVKVRYNEGITSFTRLPDFADGATFMEMSNEALTTRGSTPRYSEEEIEKTRTGVDPMLYADVDWYDELFNKTGQSRQFNLHLNGGSELASYYVSTSYFNEVGLFKTDELTRYNSQISTTRYNMTSNLVLNPTKTTELKLGIQGYLSTGNFPGTDGGTIYNNAFFTTPVIHPPKYPDDRIANQTGGVLRNPYAMLTQTGYRTNARNQIYSNMRITQDLGMVVEGLNFSGMFSYDAYNFSSDRREKSPDTYIVTGRDAEDELTFSQTYIGQEYLGFSRVNNGTRSTYLELSLDYNNDFGNHNVGGMLLFNQSDRTQTHSNDFISSLPYRYRGLAGRSTYSYDKRYYLEFNFGYNGSENFHPDERYGFFPSLGAGWTISNEQFFQPVKKAIQYAKIRFSHGLVGSSELSGRRFAYLATVANASGYTFGSNLSNSYSGVTIGEYASDVTWETSEKTNIGLDLWILNNSVNLQVDAFREYRSGIFLRRGSLPRYTGILNTPYGNVGIVENKGIDGSLKYTGKVGNFRFEALANANYNRNLVVRDDLPPWEHPWLEREGRKVGQRFGYVALGLFESEEEIANSPVQSGDVRPGDIKFKDVSGDGVINDDDLYPIGYGSIPEWTYGFGFTAGYKSFTVSTFFQGVGNVDIYLSGEGLQPFHEGLSRGNLYSNIEDRWTEENPDPTAFYPRLMVGSLNQNYRQNSWWVRNGRYLRLKNAQITYSFPSQLVRRLQIRNANVFLSGVNVLTFSDFKLWDVELGDGRGADYPHTSTYSLGIEINF